MVSLRSLLFLLPAATAFSPSLPSTTNQYNQYQHLPSLSSTALSAQIQFVRGLSEKTIPSIKVTRARDGSSGTATFQFDNPNVFDASTADSASGGGEITGMFLIDEEGEMSTTDVNAKFLNGKPQSIESVLVMRSPAEWDRFMRFMEKYGEENGLGFTKAA